MQRVEELLDRLKRGRDALVYDTREDLRFLERIIHAVEVRKGSLVGQDVQWGSPADDPDRLRNLITVLRSRGNVAKELDPSDVEDAYRTLSSLVKKNLVPAEIRAGGILSRMLNALPSGKYPSRETVRKILSRECSRRELDCRISVQEEKRHLFDIAIGTHSYSYGFMINMKTGLSYHGHIEISSQERGDGLGRRLVNTREAFCRRLGIRVIIINRNENPSFWKHMGYSELGFPMRSAYRLKGIRFPSTTWGQDRTGQGKR